MELHFDDFALTLRAGDLDVPYGLRDEILFLSVRSHLAALLCSGNAEIFCFGLAPDNTADGQDELLGNGVFYRIIGYEKNLGIGLESAPDAILQAYRYLVENFEPRWSSIIVEQGAVKKEVTVELLYQEVF